MRYDQKTEWYSEERNYDYDVCQRCFWCSNDEIEGMVLKHSMSVWFWSTNSQEQIFNYFFFNLFRPGMPCTALIIRWKIKSTWFHCCLILWWQTFTNHGISFIFTYHCNSSNWRRALVCDVEKGSENQYIYCIKQHRSRLYSNILPAQTNRNSATLGTTGGSEVTYYRNIRHTIISRR